ncbi:MAG TPA: NAD-dependent deacylase [Flavobacteriia bacterium]|nr:NAD-dependent deacylase [Flavobacteriia bacterium]
MKKITVLTGAGISADSGIKTCRDAGGLWEDHNIMEVATPQGFQKNPELVLDFYNKRRLQLVSVEPNQAHFDLASLQQNYTVQIITQNVDDLHERAGSKHVLYLHGELLKARSTKDTNLIYNWKKDIKMGDLCEKKSQLRPHIVWFGEAVPMMDKAIDVVKDTDIFIIIGTSMQVYPAASLIQFIPTNTPIFFIDPEPSIAKNAYPNLTIIPEIATKGTEILKQKLKNL